MATNRSTLADRVLLDWTVKYGVGTLLSPPPCSLRMTMADFAAEILRLESPSRDEVARITQLYASLVEWPDRDQEQPLLPRASDHEA